ncbi:hypothetical protein [Pseudomonas aeruginosa]|uniref:hypothetical protein n=1 Tax=Pseudomonas aeruginosa TaxID=287 RepID=UPI003FD13F1C
MKEKLPVISETLSEALKLEVPKLPRLPSLVRYLDDFADEWRTIRNVTDCDQWSLQADGVEFTLDFGAFPQPLKVLLKHWVIWELARVATTSVKIYFHSLRQLHGQEGYSPLSEFITRTPQDLREYWHETLLIRHKASVLRALKSLLFFICEMSLGYLTPGHVDFVGAFRWPRNDKYAAVRTGDVFLGADEEVAIVDFLDEANNLIRYSPDQVADSQLRVACILCIAYQYAMRPIQIAKVRLSDVRIYPGTDDGGPAVHITFLRVKQRSNSNRCKPSVTSG